MNSENSKTYFSTTYTKLPIDVEIITKYFKYNTQVDGSTKL